MMTLPCTMDVQILADQAGGIGAPPPEMENLSAVVGSGVDATLPYLNAQLVRLTSNNSLYKIMSTGSSKKPC